MSVDVQAQRDRLAPLYGELEKVLVGQRVLLDRILIGLLTGGHVLIEGVPGLAKTLTVRTLAKALRLQFQRIQFTPDLLPADVLGTQIYNPRTAEFTIRKGPIFANLVLADEINRAPAKVQSALLEAMEEKQVTIGETSYRLEEPFLVLATQNPLEQEGTYPLPEAQVDRFMLKLLVHYPSKDEELLILDRMAGVEHRPSVEPVLGPQDLLLLRQAIDTIHLDEQLKRYIVDIVRATREPQEYGLDIKPYLNFGGSVRATLYLTRASRAQAFLEGRGYVTPEDIKSVGPDILRHRLGLSYEAEAEEITADKLLQRVFDTLRVP
jgi:MoxR-like ATPase